MTKKLGLQDENGKLVETKVREAMATYIKDDAKLNEAVKECAVDKGNAGDTSALLWSCMRKHRIE